MLEAKSTVEAENRPPSDEELVTLAKSGDHPAFVELIKRHRSTSFKLAYSMLRDRSDTEDEVQNATWKAFAHLEQFQCEAKFSTWLASIVLNQCLMRLRKAKRARFFYIDDFRQGDEKGTPDLSDPADTPEVDLRRRELSQIVRHEVKQMPLILQTVIWMRDIQEQSMREVAAELRISLFAAKSRLLRARQELKSRLERPRFRLSVIALAARSNLPVRSN